MGAFGTIIGGGEKHILLETLKVLSRRHSNEFYFLVSNS